MDIKQAIIQIKQVPSVLEAFKTIDELLTLVVVSREAIDGMTKTKAGLESSISEKNSEFSAIEEKYKSMSEKLALDYEKANQGKQQMLKDLKEKSQHEYDEAKTSSDAKIDELKGVVRDFQGKANDLAAEIIEKKEFLKGLNQSIDSIKARLAS